MAGQENQGVGVWSVVGISAGISAVMCGITLGAVILMWSAVLQQTVPTADQIATAWRKQLDASARENVRSKPAPRTPASILQERSRGE